MKEHKIAVIGLGYVGLPLARLFSTKYNVIGYDINEKRVEELNKGIDSTLEVDNKLLEIAINTKMLVCTTNKEDIRDCNIYVVAVPTPVDDKYKPDLTPLIKSSELVGSVVKKNDIVIYESTTFPCCTEEVCVPEIEKASGLKYNKDFFVGYSPERINPGDKEHTVEKIKKVTSGSNEKTSLIVDELYNSVLLNGTFRASSIKVAEASKIIENTQRDINIAFFNELAKIFNAMGIDTKEVVDAASTKWNFIRLQPGLVGGHCIGVDPYYLIQKAEDYKVNPVLIKSGRQVNEDMSDYIANKIIHHMNKRGILVKGSNILVMGVTFKENCPDIRNTKVVKIYNKLSEYTNNITVVDGYCNKQFAKDELGVDVVEKIPNKKYDVVVLAVPHENYLDINYNDYLSENGFVYDVKSILPKNDNTIRL